MKTKIKLYSITIANEINHALLRYTLARDSIIGAFDSLSSYEWQMEHQVDPNYKHALFNSILCYCFDRLIENYRLDEIQEANSQLHLINNIIKWDKLDAVYYKHVEWPRVIYGAIICRRYMAANNLKYEFWREFAEAEEFKYKPAIIAFFIFLCS